MWHAQVTMQRENATTDKLNVNPQLIHEEVNPVPWPLFWEGSGYEIVKKLAWFSDGLKSSTHSLPQVTSSHLKIRKKKIMWKRVLTLPPRETQAGE